MYRPSHLGEIFDSVCNPHSPRRSNYVQIQRMTNIWYSAEYSSFSISDETSGYRLNASGYVGNAGDTLCRESYIDKPGWISNGKMFSTIDHISSDSDTACVTSSGSGCWWNSCATCALNVDTMGSWYDVSRVGSNDVIASWMMVKISWQ
jgi:Fibrinogen beta and gamma chains, C-terminal globular domain